MRRKCNFFRFQDNLKSVPFCKGYNDDANGLEGILRDQYDDLQFDCSQAVGYLSVYR